MKARQLGLATALALGLLLTVAVVAYATQTGVRGDLWDSATPAARWQYGATVYAAGCDALGNLDGNLYGVQTLAPGVSTFNFPWGTGCGAAGCVNEPTGPYTPTNGSRVCMYVVWGAGPQGQPTDKTTTPLVVIAFVPGVMNFGNITSGTGPTAVTLSSLSARSNAAALPILAVAGVLLVGSVATALMIRRRRA